jgi:hypothetical protein
MKRLQATKNNKGERKSITAVLLSKTFIFKNTLYVCINQCILYIFYLFLFIYFVFFYTAKDI